MASRNHKVEIVVGVKDLASRGLRGIQNSFNNLNRNAGNMGGHWTNFNRGLDTSIKKMDQLANSMYRFNMYTSSIQRNLGNVGLIGGAAGGALAYQGLNNAVQFDYKSHIMQSRMGVSNDVRKQIEDYVLSDLNLRVGFNPTEIMDMGVILGQGGISSAPDMKALMDTTTYFSEAVDAVPAQAAEMIISAAKGFNISMENSGDITDKLTVALNSSLLHVEELPHAIGELSGRAAMYGQSFESSLTALMVSRDQGMSAAQGAQDFLHGLRSVSYIGNEMTLFPKRRSYYEALGVDTGFFDMDKQQLKEYPEIIKSLEKTMINNGFVNPKYKDIKNYDDYQALLDKEGTAPADFWNKKEAMPLIGRVFGAAGMAPMMMGLQSKYEEVDKETGEKTGKVYYGSAAVEKMYSNLKNSDGAVEGTHDIIAQSGKYQLDILGGAWQATQIKFLDNMVPLIKAGAEQLTGYLSGDGFSRAGFRNAYQDSADNFRSEGNTTTANIIENVGQGILDGIDIGSTLPPMFEQIGEAISDNFIHADWGDSLIEFPWHIVENGIGFITDILKANEDFNELVARLPDRLEDPAKLIEGLAKGGLILLVSGAIVKAIELSLRAASTAMKTGKAAINVGEFILDSLGLKKSKKGKSALDGLLGKNSNINANIVNVYGKVVNDGGDIDGAGKGKSRSKGGGGGAKTASKGTLRGALKSPQAIIAASIGGYVAASSVGWSKWKQEVINNENANFKSIVGVVQEGKGTEQEILNNIKANHTTVAKGKDVDALKGFLTGMDSKLDSINDGVYGGFGNGAQGLIDKLSANREAGGGMDKFNSMMESLNSGSQQLVDSSVSAQENLIGGGQQLVDNSVVAQENVNSSIASGFNAANERLQNIRLQNSTSVNVSPPQVIVSGSIAPHVNVSSRGSSSFTSSSNQSGGDRFNQDRNANIMKRRLGW
jgi:hypothetical protein